MSTRDNNSSAGGGGVDRRIDDTTATTTATTTNTTTTRPTTATPTPTGITSPVSSITSPLTSTPTSATTQPLLLSSLSPSSPSSSLPTLQLQHQHQMNNDHYSSYPPTSSTPPPTSPATASSRMQHPRAMPGSPTSRNNSINNNRGPASPLSLSPPRLNPAPPSKHQVINTNAPPSLPLLNSDESTATSASSNSSTPPAFGNNPAVANIMGRQGSGNLPTSNSSSSLVSLGNPSSNAIRADSPSMHYHRPRHTAPQLQVQLHYLSPPPPPPSHQPPTLLLGILQRLCRKVTFLSFITFTPMVRRDGSRQRGFETRRTASGRGTDTEPDDSSIDLGPSSATATDPDDNFSFIDTTSVDFAKHSLMVEHLYKACRAKGWLEAEGDEGAVSLRVNTVRGAPPPHKPGMRKDTVTSMDTVRPSVDARPSVETWRTVVKPSLDVSRAGSVVGREESLRSYRSYQQKESSSMGQATGWNVTTSI
ncbi:hypothetical protein BC829DRAFT_436344 [Chytridium lagenaria]|nr:hypothetical protein BC829DRAFT_436344 [Chytridium lagenaria]